METSEIVTRLLVAVVLGSLIGLEREYRKKSAGFRTMILISLGSALLTIISLELYRQFPENTDPTRISSYIVSGIGFLGAGVIMKREVDSVKGITTAASIWLVAAIGMSAGSGLYIVGIVSTLIAFVALFLLPKIEIYVSRMNEYTKYDIIVSDADFLESLDVVFSDNNLKMFSKKRSKKENGYQLTVGAFGDPSDHERAAWTLIDSEKVISFDN